MTSTSVPGAGGRGPLIRIEHLTKQFGDQLALADINLSVERGETLVIIGGSGAGKSTLVRQIVGLDRPTSGHVYIDGIELNALREHEAVQVRRRLAMVFQRDALLDAFNVFDNVAFPLREERALDEETIRERVMLYLTELGVDDAAAKLPGELSGGMAKRVGIARAMATQPEIIVYDEPTSGLDPISARVVDGLIDQMRSRFLVTSIVITHDMATAIEIADRVAVLARGRLVALGTPEEILCSDRPDVRHFADSSGVDPARLPPRRKRPPPAEIRASWEAQRAAGAPGQR